MESIYSSIHRLVGYFYAGPELASGAEWKIVWNSQEVMGNRAIRSED